MRDVWVTIHPEPGEEDSEGDVPPLSEEQRVQRLAGIGSSEIASLCGESPYSTPHHVYMVKRGLIDESDEETDQTWLGHELEPSLGRWYANEMGCRIVPGPGTVRHPEHSWALATTDFEHEDGSRIVECKTVGWRVEHHWDESREDGVPTYVMLQETWQMGIRGIHEAAVPVLFTSDARKRIFLARFDERIFRSMLTIGERFWRENVLGEVPPETDGSEDARTLLKKLYPRNTRSFIQAPPGAYDAVVAYCDAKAAEKMAKGDASLAGNRLRKMIGDAEGIEGDGFRATWTNDKTGKRTLRVTMKGREAA